MTSFTTKVLDEPGFWATLVDGYSMRMAARPKKVVAYRELVESGAMVAATRAYGEQRLRLATPARRLINRSGGRRKTVYMFPPHDDLFLKGLNRALQRIDGLHSPLCHSFQPGRGVRTAYAALKQVAGLNDLACVHLDVHEYFASIAPDRMLRALPPALIEDGPLVTLLRETLRDPSAGVMAGTPLAPLLSNLYLRPLDDLFEADGVAYLRYADDLVVFGDAGTIVHHRETITERLADLGLELNQRKTRASAPGGAWEFLGLKYDQGRIDLATTTVRKMHHRVRRLARRARAHDDPTWYVVRRLNRKLYGSGADASEFTWATWFFPLIGSDDSLRRLDGVIQEQLRFAATGKHERRNRGAIPYGRLKATGYVPLVTAFRAFRRGPGDYEALLDRRLVPSGAGASPPHRWGGQARLGPAALQEVGDGTIELGQSLVDLDHLF
jgi:RNA-directed DNA polymerase